MEERPDFQTLLAQNNEGFERNLSERRGSARNPEARDMPLGQRIRASIFGGTPRTHSRIAEVFGDDFIVNRTHRTAPNSLGTHGLIGEVLRMRNFNSVGTARGLSETLTDPRIQRVIERHAPGGVEHLRGHIDAILNHGPAPAFDIKKLRGDGVKVAIEWRSPKMQAILEAARDQAYGAGFLKNREVGLARVGLAKNRFVSNIMDRAEQNPGSRARSKKARNKDFAKILADVNDRPDARAIDSAFSEGRRVGQIFRGEPVDSPLMSTADRISAMDARRRSQRIAQMRALTRGPPEEHLRRVIFGSVSRPNGMTSRSVPHPREYTDKRHRLFREIAEFRRYADPDSAANLRELIDRRGARTLLAKVPGGRERLLQLMNSAEKLEPWPNEGMPDTPAFDIKKLRGDGVKTAGRVSRGLGAYLIGAQLLGGMLGVDEPTAKTTGQKFESGLAGAVGAGAGTIATPFVDSYAGYKKDGPLGAVGGAAYGLATGPVRGYNEAQRIRAARPWMKYTPAQLFKKGK